MCEKVRFKLEKAPVLYKKVNTNVTKLNATI